MTAVMCTQRVPLGLGNGKAERMQKNQFPDLFKVCVQGSKKEECEVLDCNMHFPPLIFPVTAGHQFVS